MPSDCWSRISSAHDVRPRPSRPLCPLALLRAHLPYCDFNVYKAAHAQPEALLDAMLRDLAHWRARLGARPVHSVHFGGGTPSLMEPSAIAAILEQADALFGLAPGAEIGLEANPMEHERFEGIAAAGVERLSLGVQALDDDSLKALGRDHDARTGLQALERAQSLFKRISLDLIYARENQTPEGWRAELETALGFETGHMSLYQLTIEPGTRSRASSGAARSPRRLTMRRRTCTP